MGKEEGMNVVFDHGVAPAGLCAPLGSYLTLTAASPAATPLITNTAGMPLVGWIVGDLSDTFNARAGTYVDLCASSKGLA